MMIVRTSLLCEKHYDAFLITGCVVYFAYRYLSSCGILMTRVSPFLRTVSGRPALSSTRSFFNLTDSFNKRKEYSERRIIG